MNKLSAVAAVLAFAGVASAAPFAINGAVDFSGGTVAGGLGDAISYDGAANLAFFGGLLNVGALGSFEHSGVTVGGIPSVAFAPGSAGWAGGQLAGAWFNSAGAPVQSTTLGELDGIQIANFDSGLSNIQVGAAFIQIDGVNTEFNGLDTGEVYQLTLVDGQFGTELWVVNVPTPGAAGLLGVAGLAAVRRRR